MSCPMLTRLTQDISGIMQFPNGHDVMINVGEPPDCEQFRAHSIVLRARSSYFSTALKDSWVMQKDGVYYFEKPNVTPRVFRVILGYMYAVFPNLDVMDMDDVIDVLIAADEMIFEELVMNIQMYLVENHKIWLEKNLIKILNVVHARPACRTLREHCINNIVCQDATLLFNENICSLDEDVLLDLLWRDDLAIGETTIWQHVIKWVLARHENLENRPINEWSKGDLLAVTNTLSPFLSLVRFSQIPPTDFMDDIKPYEKLLPPRFMGEYLRYHLAGNQPSVFSVMPSRMPRIDTESAIIKARHAAVLTEWIDQDQLSEIFDDYAPYAFRCLYRASRDSLSSKVFHEHVDKCRSPTLLVIKLNGDAIVGGYNAVKGGWKRGWFSSTRGSRNCFLFSFFNAMNIPTATLSRVIPNEKQNAIYDHPWEGACFGIGPDLWVSTNANYPVVQTKCKSYQYSVLGSEGFTRWEDWEILEVKRVCV